MPDRAIARCHRRLVVAADRAGALIGRLRFGEFHKSLGVAKNILAARPRKLVAHGIMEIVPAADGSAYQEYVLTEKGKRLQIVLMAIWQWGETALFAPGRCGSSCAIGETASPCRA